MRIRIFENQELDLDTVEQMLLMADKQANFNPNTHWIVDTIEGESINYNQDEEGLKKRYKELSLKWTGREAVVMWLTSNQISFEVISYEYLAEEQKALSDYLSQGQMSQRLTTFTLRFGIYTKINKEKQWEWM